MIVKKVVLAVAVVMAVAVLAWGATWYRAEQVAEQSAAKSWPSTLGSLEAVPKRFPKQEQNAAATKLVHLAAAANVNVKPLTPGEARRSARRNETDRLFQAVSDYVTTQLERANDTIDAPPPLVAQYLESSDAPMTAVREQLIRGGEVRWTTDVSRGFAAPIPNLIGQLQLQRVLVARALDRARSGNAAAWEELHASWELSRGLWGRPELISNMIALASTRLMNAAARKMPAGDVPAWFVATRSFDPLTPLVGAQQTEAWQMHEEKSYGIETLNAVLWFVTAPVQRFEVAKAIEATRDYVTAIERAGACDIDNVRVAFPIAMPSVKNAYARALRLRAEMEATDRVLALRRGEVPSTASRCTDGSWVVTATSAKFTPDIEVVKPNLNVPLSWSGALRVRE